MDATAALAASYRTLVEGDTLLLVGPYDTDLAVRMRRIGGKLRPSSPLAAWTVPRDKEAALKRVLDNWRTAALQRAGFGSDD